MSADTLKVIVDTGFLIALHDRSDKHHQAAKLWLNGFKGKLISVQNVLTETSFFLSTEHTAILMDQIAAGWIELSDPDPVAYRRIALLFRKFADQDPDLTDIALIWLAEAVDIHSILTVDINDFSTYRINGRAKFNLLPWLAQS